MIKNIVKTWIPCLALAVGLTGCYDEMDSKASVDEQYASSNAPTAEIGAATVIDYSSFSVSGSISSTENVLEAGFQVSSSEDFSGASFYPAEEISTSFNATIDNLKDNTTYYVRTYAVTRAAGTSVSSAQTATLPKAPEFEDTYLIGTYSAIDIDVTSGEAEGDPYPVKIAQGSMWNKVVISNIWGAGCDIEATVDFEKKTITTDPNSTIYVDPDYGNVWAWGFTIENGNIAYYDTCVTVATYDDKGNVHFGYWAPVDATGAWGYYYMTELVKQ